MDIKSLLKLLGKAAVKPKPGLPDPLDIAEGMVPVHLIQNAYHSSLDPFGRNIGVSQMVADAARVAGLGSIYEREMAARPFDQMQTAAMLGSLSPERGTYDEWSAQIHKNAVAQLRKEAGENARLAQQHRNWDELGQSAANIFKNTNRRMQQWMANQKSLGITPTPQQINAQRKVVRGAQMLDMLGDRPFRNTIKSEPDKYPQNLKPYIIR